MDHIEVCRRCQRRMQGQEPGWRNLMPADGKLHVGTSTAVIPDPIEMKARRAASHFDNLSLASRKIGRYEIESEIARGGMGVVFKARDTELERCVAIKLLSSDRVGDLQWMNRFHREARLTSGLNHPNIVTVHEIGNFQGVPFLVTEFVVGRTLRQLLKEQELSCQQSVGYAIQIAAGMAAAHAGEIIHRDLKPANIMIRDDGIAKILDFGLARSSYRVESLFETSLSSSGMLIGTVAYMSPEQGRGYELECSTDVFSFGTILYYMLTGIRPFRGETPSDVTAAILTRTPRPISEFREDIPSALQGLVLKCLNKDREFRPGSMEIVNQLRALDIKPVLPGPSPLHVDTMESDFAVDSASQSTTMSSAGRTVVDLQKVGPIRYARSGDVNIAWQEVGAGPIDIVFVMGWVSHLDWFWKDPSFAVFLQRLATFSRVILFDKRGTGLSDRVPVHELPTLETRMDDVRAVMEAASSERAVLCGVSEGGPLCTMFAATYPHKTIALTMIGCYARRLWAEDYPWGPKAEQRELFLEEIARSWGGPLGIEDRAPSQANDPVFRDWWASYLRMGASPGAAVALTKMNAQIDVRPILPSIQVPTLVIHRTGDRCLSVEEGRHMAELIPGAKFVELPGNDHLPFIGNVDEILDEIQEFLTGRRHAPTVDRVLATVLCIAVETNMEAGGSDKIWQQFKNIVAQQAQLFRGKNLIVKDRTLWLTFDGPGRAIRAANAICGLGGRLGADVRCGVDMGACDIDADSITGAAVDYACKIAAIAPADSVLISDSVRNLAAGSELEFIENSVVVDIDDSLSRTVFLLVR